MLVDDKLTVCNHCVSCVYSFIRAQVHLWPSTQEASELFRANVAKVFFYMTQLAEGSVKGYAVVAKGQGQGQGFEAKHTWTVAFPPEQEHISALGSRQPEAVQAAVRVLSADGAYAHKYLNPNMLVVATVRNPPTTGLNFLLHLSCSLIPLNVVFVQRCVWCRPFAARPILQSTYT